MKYRAFSLLILLVCATAYAGSDIPIEVVQSVPLETTLTVPGIRLAQEVWLEMINGAKSTIDIEQFYISNQAGQSLDPVIQAIKAAATQRGVKVRLMADTKMAKTYPETVAEIGKTPGCEARLISYASSGGIQHAKFFIIDGKQAFVGSQNFDWRALDHIHEIGLRLTESTVISDLGRIFEKDWAAATTSTPAASAITPTESPSASQENWATVVASPPQTNPAGIPDSLSSIIKLIASAKQSVRVQVMAYSTAGHWRDLDDALRKAARSGIKVQLLLDIGHVKSAKADLASLAAVPNIEVKAATLPAWSGGAIDFARLVHSKYLVIDNGSSAWVGTENWSKGYFLSSRDVGLIVSNPGIAGQLDRVFSQVWTSSYASGI
ncbi:phospholipase D-like domain-containing protein [Bdellovibrionota bacterium FG-1]